MYHFFITLVFLLGLYKFKGIPQKYGSIVFLFLVLYLKVFITSFIYGFNFLSFNYFFISVIFFIFITFFDNIDSIKVIRLLRVVVSVLLLYVFFNVLLNYDSVKLAQAQNIMFGIRPLIPNMVFGGGLNLESTWIAMLTVFFIRSRFFILAIMVSAFIAASYMSRTGFLISAIVFLFWFYDTQRLKFTFIQFYIFLPVFTLLGCVALYFILLWLDLPIIERFLIIGEEPGSNGRLDILSYIGKALVDSYFMGYGPGNVMVTLAKYGLDSDNDNVHNYFIQLLLDFGFMGFLVYLYFAWTYLNSRVIPFEFKMFFFLYLVGSLVQFRGAEPVLWFIVFAGLATKNGVKTDA